MNKDLNLKEYKYDLDQEISINIPGKMLETLLEFLDTIQKVETHYGISDTYSKTTKEVFDKSKNLVKVEQKLEQYPNMQSYATQPFQVFKTELGAVALEMLMNFKQIHLDNIEKGIAKKQGIFEMAKEIKA